MTTIIILESYTIHCNAWPLSNVFLHSLFTTANLAEHLTKIRDHFWLHTKSLNDLVTHVEVRMYCISNNKWNTRRIFPKILRDGRQGTITEVSMKQLLPVSTDTQMKPYLCAGGKLLQLTAEAGRTALINTSTGPPPLRCWRPAATKPGSTARQSYTLADSSLLFFFFHPLFPPRLLRRRHQELVARADLPPSRPSRNQSLGCYRWIDSANFGNHRPWVDCSIWQAVVPTP